MYGLGQLLKCGEHHLKVGNQKVFETYFPTRRSRGTADGKKDIKAELLMLLGSFSTGRSSFGQRTDSQISVTFSRHQKIEKIGSRPSAHGTRSHQRNDTLILHFDCTGLLLIKLTYVSPDHDS
jgi:hypothetical protein